MSPSNSQLIVFIQTIILEYQRKHPASRLLINAFNALVGELNNTRMIFFQKHNQQQMIAEIITIIALEISRSDDFKHAALEILAYALGHPLFASKIQKFHDFFNTYTPSQKTLAHCQRVILKKSFNKPKKSNAGENSNNRGGGFDAHHEPLHSMEIDVAIDPSI